MSPFIIKGKGGKNNMGEIILKNAVCKEQGYLYYVDGEGNVCKAEMKRGRKKKQENTNEKH